MEVESKITPRLLAYKQRFKDHDLRELVIPLENLSGPILTTFVLFSFGYRKFLAIQHFTLSKQLRGACQLCVSLSFKEKYSCVVIVAVIRDVLFSTKRHWFTEDLKCLIENKSNTEIMWKTIQAAICIGFSCLQFKKMLNDNYSAFCL